MMTKQKQLLAKLMVPAARAALGVQQTETAKTLCQAIAQLWPDCPDLVELQIVNCILTQQTGEAMALLHGRTDTRSLAFLAVCMHRLRNPAWREPLHTVLTREDDEGALQLAYRILEVTGETVVPEREAAAVLRTPCLPFHSKGVRA
jgi:hypothetical protein